MLKLKPGRPQPTPAARNKGTAVPASLNPPATTPPAALHWIYNMRKLNARKASIKLDVVAIKRLRKCLLALHRVLLPAGASVTMNLVGKSSPASLLCD